MTRIDEHADSVGARLADATGAQPLEILFFLRAQNFDRLFEAVLEDLLGRGHHVHVAFEVQKKAKFARFADSVVFDELARRHGGRLTFQRAPAEADARVAGIERKLRLGIDYLRYLKPEYAAAEALRERARGRTWPPIVRLATRSPLRGPRGRALLERVMRGAVDRLPLDQATLRLIADRAPDLVLVSPLVQLGGTQGRHIRAARALGVPTAVLVASWDNLTNKGVILDPPDLVVVWNQAQVEEAVGLHGIPSERVVATGAPPYDQWFERRASTTAREFCRRVGLDEERPYILYVCSSRFVARNEHLFVAEWLERLRSSPTPELREIGILVRPHPANGKIWREIELDDPGRTVVYPPEGEVPRQDDSKAEYFDSIHHAAAVVGINTSAIVETAIIGRPVFTVLDERFRGTQGGTLHFEYIDARHGGPLNVAEGFDEHFAQLERAVREGAPAEQLRSFVERFVRPHGPEERAAPRVTAALERLVAQDRQARPLRAHGGSRPLRVLRPAGRAEQRKTRTRGRLHARDPA